MRTKQEVCAVIAGTLFLGAAGVIETMPEVSLALIAAMAIPALIGKLDKKRLTCKDVERRCADAEN